jgi:hypothetical protein
VTGAFGLSSSSMYASNSITATQSALRADILRHNLPAKLVVQLVVHPMDCIESRESSTRVPENLHFERTQRDANNV